MNVFEVIGDLKKLSYETTKNKTRKLFQNNTFQISVAIPKDSNIMEDKDDIRYAWIYATLNINNPNMNAYKVIIQYCETKGLKCWFKQTHNYKRIGIGYNKQK